MSKPKTKPWERGKPKRKQRTVIDTALVVCEGEQTESNYFRQFPKSNVVEVEIKGTGYNTLSLVKEARRLKAEGESVGKRYNQVWCVFDKDSFGADFDNAIKAASDAGFQAAYSNEAFELWFLLHYDFCDSALSRSQYAEKLRERLRRPYQKNDKTMYKTLLARQPQAIQNAKNLLARYQPHRPGRDNPCTTVHLLVERLNQLAEGD